MNGTWEALIEDRVDLVIGAPAPVPTQKGIRAVKINELENILVVSHTHPLAKVNKPIALSELVQYCHVIVHYSSKNEIPWSVNIIKGSQR